LRELDNTVQRKLYGSLREKGRQWQKDEEDCVRETLLLVKKKQISS